MKNDLMTDLSDSAPGYARGLLSAQQATKAQTAADALHTLGLFNGTGSNADGTPIYDLDRTPTRHEAVTMLVRLLGKESDA